MKNFIMIIDFEITAFIFEAIMAMRQIEFCQEH